MERMSYGRHEQTSGGTERSVVIPPQERSLDRNCFSGPQLVRRSVFRNASMTPHELCKGWSPHTRDPICRSRVMKGMSPSPPRIVPRPSSVSKQNIRAPSQERDQPAGGDNFPADESLQAQRRLSALRMDRVGCVWGWCRPHLKLAAIGYLILSVLTELPARSPQ
jgi:hypothetical protein